MDKNEVSPDELAAEQAALAEKKEEEVRAAIISEFGFDEEADAERIDKLVDREMEHSKKLSTAIGQKIKYRKEATEKATTTTTPPPPPATATTVKPEEIETLVSKQLEQRDLDALDYPDDLKKEIKRVADITGVSIKAALRDPYIVTKVTEHEKTAKAEEAAINRTNRSGGSKTYSKDRPPEVDMSTPEGRMEWEKYVDWLRTQS